MKYACVLLIVIHICPFSALSKTFDARSNAMGGVGVSNAPIKVAAFHNPALMSLHYVKNPNNTTEIQIFSVDAEIHKIKELINRTNDFARNLKTLNKLADSTPGSITPTSTELFDVFDSLEQLEKVRYSRFELGATASFAQQTNLISYSLSIQRTYDFLLIPSIDKSELNATSIIASMTTGSKRLNSNIFLLYKTQTDYSLSFSNPVAWISDKLHFGVGIKYQSVVIGSYFPDINTTSGDTKKNVLSDEPLKFYDDRVKEATEYNNLNFDIGLIYEAHKLIHIGVAVRNLVPQTYKVKKRNELELDYISNPIPVLGISYVHPLVNLSVQVDAYPRRNYEHIRGTVGVIKDSVDDEQFLRMGLETNYEDVFFFRAGYRINFYAPENEKSSFSIGFGIVPATLFNINIALRLRDQYNAGVTLETGLQF